MMHSRSGEAALGRIDLAHETNVLQTGRIVFSGSAGALTNDPRVRDAHLGGSEDT